MRRKSLAEGFWPDIKEDIKVKLREKYAMLNPVELKRNITKLQIGYLN